MTEARNKVRNVKRLLEHSAGNMPADVRMEKERELAAYEHDLEILLQNRVDKQTLGKYHFVRFLGKIGFITSTLTHLQVSQIDISLERKRATRNFETLLSEARQAKENLPPEERSAALEDLQPRLEAARIDINYTVYAPLREKYVSLFPNLQQDDQKHAPHNPTTDPRNRDPSKALAVEDNATGEKPPLWYVVKKCMEDGGTVALAKLRDGKLATDADRTTLVIRSRDGRGDIKVEGVKLKGLKLENIKKEEGEDEKKLKIEPSLPLRQRGETTKMKIRHGVLIGAKMEVKKEKKEEEEDDIKLKEELEAKEKRALKTDSDGDDSDGGFFER